MTGFCRSIAGIVTAAHRGKLKTMFCRIRRMPPYHVCRHMMLVAHDVCRLIMLVSYDICCLMRFVAYEVFWCVVYDVCHIWGPLVCRLCGLSQCRNFPCIIFVLRRIIWKGHFPPQSSLCYTLQLFCICILCQNNKKETSRHFLFAKTFHSFRA